MTFSLYLGVLVAGRLMLRQRLAVFSFEKACSNFNCGSRFGFSIQLCAELNADQSMEPTRIRQVRDYLVGRTFTCRRPECDGEYARFRNAAYRHIRIKEKAAAYIIFSGQYFDLHCSFSEQLFVRLISGTRPGHANR